MKVIRSLRYAVKGILYAIKNERNMRIHTVIAGYVLAFSLICGMNVSDYAILFLTISLVMMAEMFNSAIENLIDLCSKEYNTTAKIAKDIAAGGVLVVSMAAVAVGLVLFGSKEAYNKLWAFFCVHKFIFILFLLSAFTSYFYIFWGPTELKNKFQNFFRRSKNRLSITNKIGGDSDEK